MIAANTTLKTASGLVLLVVGLTSLGVAKSPRANSWHGSIQVSGKHSDAELARMVKISAGRAAEVAMGAIKAPGASKKVSASEVEAEHGYLIYSVEVKVSGKPGIQEVTVDAGTGKVLQVAYEGPAAEVSEAATEKRESKSGGTAKVNKGHAQGRVEKGGEEKEGKESEGAEKEGAEKTGKG